MHTAFMFAGHNTSQCQRHQAQQEVGLHGKPHCLQAYDNGAPLPEYNGSTGESGWDPQPAAQGAALQSGSTALC